MTCAPDKLHCEFNEINRMLCSGLLFRIDQNCSDLLVDDYLHRSTRVMSDVKIVSRNITYHLISHFAYTISDIAIL